ncbi:MAG TPA: lysoplasmalogenase [Clostridia bacterium]|nr:lysoplasmalogenase [Clostridia bacterium]
MTLALALVFAAVSLVHLYACFTARFKLRAATKPLLMPLLAALYLVSAKSPHPLVAGALLLGAVGDVFLLLPKKQVFLMIGGAAFGLGHILYVTSIFSYTGVAQMPLFIIPIVAVCYGTAAAVAFLKLRPSVPQKLRGGIVFYMLLLCAMSASAILSLVASPSADRLLLALGGLLFISSDAILAKLLFVREGKRGNFPVMATYLAAQALLAAGFMVM